MTIVVVAGTHELPFDRLVVAAEQLARDGSRVMLQRGTSRIPAPSAAVDGAIWSPAELASRMQQADVVITHGGPGSILGAREAGHVPVVLAREARLGEHVDDHQVQFCRRIMDQIRLADSISAVVALVQSGTGRPPGDPAAEGRARSAAYARKLSDLIDTLRG